MRLALLRANDDYGDVILVINTADLDQRFERVRATPGVRVSSEPQMTEY